MPIEKPNLTPGQGLLLLIQHYQDDKVKQNELKKLYLTGASDGNKCIAVCDYLLNEPLLDDYNLVIDEHSIDSDPSRRYFETHLAYATVKHQISDINLEDIIRLYGLSEKLVDPKISSGKLKTIKEALKGTCTEPSFKHQENMEYSAYIQRIKTGSVFSKLSDLEREKIKWIVRFSYMTLVNGWRQTEMPFDIYLLGGFGSKARGKIRHGADQHSTGNQHFGLLKGYMPLPVDDIAFSNIPFSHLKATEYATYNPDSETVQACFQQLVHPFSNSTSGTFLLYLRVLAKLHQQQEKSVFVQSIDAMTKLIRIHLATSVYYSGGHNFYEYIVVLALPEVQEYFQCIPGFSELNLEKIFYDNNETALDEALDKTLQYNTMLFKRNKVRQELVSKYAFFSKKAEPYKTESPVSIVDYIRNIDMMY